MNDSNGREQNTSMKRSVFIGAIAGFSEVLFNHPLWVLKTRSQCRYPFTLNPFILYKGFIFHAAGDVIFSSVQIGAGIKLSETLTSNFKNSPYLPSWHTNIQLGTLSGSFLSGALAGFFSTPIDVVMVQQQKKAKIDKKEIAKDFLIIAKKIRSEYGYKVFFCGAPATGIRVALFNTGIFIGTPYFGNKLGLVFSNHAGSSLIAGGIAGIISTVVTQPIDTLKALQQDQALNHVRLNAFEHAKQLYKHSGYQGFFRGMKWRGAQVITATAVTGAVVEICRPTF